MRRIYMDANATTPVLPQVLEAMRPFWTEEFGNASSIHQRGQHARAAVDRARESVAALLNCRAAEVVFTSGGTESDNMALFGVVSPGDHLIATAIEHHAVLHAAEELEARGVEVTFLPCTGEGLVEVSALEAALRPNTKLVSVMLANNETGVIQPVRELADRAHAAGALFHTDAIQAAGKLPLDVKALGCDLLSISGHKMYAPQGTGALFVRRNVRLRSMFFGGLHERGRRPGTENVAGIVGLGKASEIATDWLAANGAWELAALRDRLERGILAAVGEFPGEQHSRAWEAGVNGGGAARVANTSNRPRRGRGAGDRARPKGTGRFGRVGVPVRRDRTIACADGDGLERCARPVECALLAQPADHGGRGGSGGGDAARRGRKAARTGAEDAASQRAGKSAFRTGPLSC